MVKEFYFSAQSFQFKLNVYALWDLCCNICLMLSILPSSLLKSNLIIFGKHSVANNDMWNDLVYNL